jgi:hypothetical protein
MTGFREMRMPFRRRMGVLAGTLSLGIMLVAGCTSPTQSSSAPSSVDGTATAAASAAPVETGSVPPTLSPTAAPTAPAATSEFGTILKVQVNGLAARIAPDRSAALVHAYNLSGPAPIDGGLVRLSKGAFVSVELGPLRVGTTTWYLVWPSKTGAFRVSDLDWYDKAPPSGTPGPGWVAGSSGTDVYMIPAREPDKTELEAFEPVGLTGFGSGAYVLGSGPRHDAFLLEWAAAAPTPGTKCTLTASLVPDDRDFAPLGILSTSTTSVKIGPRAGTRILWPEAAASTWTTFTVEVGGTCASSMRLIRLEHD